MIVHRMEQGSDAWHNVRLGRFTGTRISKLMSGKSTANYLDSIIDVATEIITGEKEEGYVSADMQRGIDMEPEAAEYYSQLFEIELNEVGFITLDEDDKISEWSGISPDRMIGDDGMLEIKCPKAKTLFKYYKDNKLPNVYKWQVQGQLFITGRKWCDFMAYYPGLKPFIIRVKPDIEMHERIRSEILIAIESVKEYIKTYKSYDHLIE